MNLHPYGAPRPVLCESVWSSQCTKDGIEELINFNCCGFKTHTLASLQTTPPLPTMYCTGNKLSYFNCIVFWNVLLLWNCVFLLQCSWLARICFYGLWCHITG